MVSIRHCRVLLAVSVAAAFALAPLPASAKRHKNPPQETQEPQEDSADVIFSKSFVGRTYDDDLAVEGWDEIDGGLVAPPIYVHRYQREDGTYLVLTSREAVKATNTAPASYVVVDALIVPKPQKDDVEFSIACVQGKDETLNFMAACGLTSATTPQIAETIGHGARIWRWGCIPPLPQLMVLGELAQSAVRGDSDVSIEEVGMLLARRFAGRHRFAGRAV